MMEAMRRQQELVMQLRALVLPLLYALFDDVIACNISVASKIEGFLMMMTTTGAGGGPVDDLLDDKSLAMLREFRPKPETNGGPNPLPRRRTRPRNPSPPNLTAACYPAPAVLVPWLGIGGGGTTAPAPAASIYAVPTVEVSEPGEVCAICKEDLPMAAAARRLPWGHPYHSCIVPWLELHNSSLSAAPASPPTPPPSNRRRSRIRCRPLLPLIQLPSQAAATASEQGEATTVVLSV
ncbi:hypothetical protein HU200_067028 [Digitaria exilis]|uniref:Uncharacterized protein n=1 Tax=Digitaria exilis TaxID=1010633 RepID=A0A835A5P9_9POAL|nr:hypothetical protein HU200_067028 [Digitaria exilis]